MLVLRDQSSSQQSIVTLIKLHRVHHENQLALTKFSRVARQNFSKVRVSYSPEENQRKRPEKITHKIQTLERNELLICQNKLEPFAYCVQRK